MSEPPSSPPSGGAATGSGVTQSLNGFGFINSFVFSSFVVKYIISGPNPGKPCS